MTKIKTPLANHKILLEISALVVIIASVTIIKLWRLGEHAFVFDEAIHVAIAKSFAANGFSWQVEREIGSVHMPLQYFVMSWWWQLASNWWPGMAEETIFRLPSVIMSSLTIPLVYLISRRFGYLVTLSATLFFAFHPYILIYTRFASLDFPGLFWLTLGLLVYLKGSLPGIQGKQQWIWISLSGFFFGVAVMTKAYSLLVLGPVVLHSLIQGWPRHWGFSNAIRQGGVVVAICLSTVVGLSWFFSQNPFLLYNAFKELLITLSTLPSEMVNKTELRFIGFLRDEVLGMRQVLQTIWSHLGAGAFIIALAGAFRLIDEDKQIGRSSAFFIIFILTGMLVFAPFHWPRYLLVMGSVIPILFAFGIKDTYNRVISLRQKFILKSLKINYSFLLTMALVFAFGASFIPLKLIPEMYRVQMVDDWVYGDGLKEAALYIKERAKKDQWIMTNGHYTILSYYAGIHAHFYMGFGPQLRIYQIYNPESRQPAVVNVDLAEENKLEFIVIDNTPGTKYSYLYQPQVNFSYAVVNSPLLTYISTYFKQVAEFQSGVVRVYQRNSHNYYSSQTLPEIWVGEGGAEWKEASLNNSNGWIFGAGWGQPKALAANNEIYLVRGAIRESNRSADFMLPIRDTSQPATLEIIFQDVGTGGITVNTLLREPKGERLENFLRPLGDTNTHIQLTNSGVIKTATIPLHPQYYFDASADIPGVQQHFSFFTQGSAIQVIKVGIVQ